MISCPSNLSQAQMWLREHLPTLEAKREAEWMLRHLLGVSRAYLIAHEDQLLDDVQLAQLQAWVYRRQEGEPLAYLLGETEFYGLRLQVTPDVLIPRADTECLVDHALAYLYQQRLFLPLPLSVLDMGTGSGAIAIAILHEFSDCQMTALDISLSALSVARQNAQHYNLGINFLVSQWFDSLPKQTFNLIVSNPPYIADDDPHLQQTSLPFEPKHALTSGIAGLDDLHHIIQHSTSWLTDGGCLLLEHGYDQTSSVQKYMQRYGFTDINTRKDLGGNDRVTQGIYHYG